MVAAGAAGVPPYSCGSLSGWRYQAGSSHALSSGLAFISPCDINKEYPAEMVNRLNDQVSDEVIRTLAAFRRELRIFLHFSETAALEAGLSPQQHQALLAIQGSERQELTVGEIADTLLLRPHSASGLITRLERSGLVVRWDGNVDARQKLVHLTSKSVGLLGQLSAAHRSELKRLRPLLVNLLSSL